MANRLDRIVEERLKKMERLRELGVEPYPNRYRRTHTTAEAVALLEKNEQGAEQPDEVNVAGRLTAIRRMGKNAFADLRDGTGKIQLLFHDVKSYEEIQAEIFKDLDIGDTIGVQGQVLRTRTGEATVRVSGFSLLSKSLQPLPEKWHGLSDTDIRFRQRYLDLISNPEVKEAFMARSRIIAAIRQYFNTHGFLEVETPVLQPSAGGALAAPFITRYNALDQDFYLRIALELHLKRLVVGGFDKVYEIGRVFRNEGISTTHSPEYTLLESYEAYADYNDVMAMTEDLIYQVCQSVLGTAIIKYGEETVNLTPPWPRISLRGAVKEHSGIDFNDFPTEDALRARMQELNIEADPKKNWAKLVDELYKTCARPRIIQPSFLIDYPVAMSPLAKQKPDDPAVVERFQAVVCGLEIANAYSELNDPLEQRQRFEEQLKERPADDGERWTIDEDYLNALEYGMPPTGGLGIGIDRLVMLFTNNTSIREVILFPQLKEKG